MEIRNTYKIPAANLQPLIKKIQKLGRRAETIGGSDIRIEVNERIEERDPKDDKKVRVFHMVEIIGEAPAIAGWNFLGTIQHGTGELGNIVRPIPGAVIPEDFRTAEPTCDQCHLSRRRNDTFVLQNDEGEFKRVGRNCLGLFLGGTDPQSAAKSAEYLAFAAELGGMSELSGDDESYGVFYYLPEFLAWVAKEIQEHGWLGRGKAYDEGREGEATADKAYYNMTNEDKVGKPFDAHYDTAQAAIEWVQNEVATRENLSDYEHNMVVICSNDGVDARGFGIAASILIAHKMDEEKKARRAEQKAISKHFGTEKKREVFELTLVGTSAWESLYGLTVLYRFEDASGNVAVWFSSDGCRGLENKIGSPRVGDTFKIKGTVKSHSEYEGVKQTVLTRCKVL